jgi:hypothetical protein
MYNIMRSLYKMLLILFLGGLLFSCSLSSHDPVTLSEEYFVDSGIQETSNQENLEYQPVKVVHPYDCIKDKRCTQLMVAAHRGCKKKYPENSLAAIRAAALLGSDFS